MCLRKCKLCKSNEKQVFFRGSPIGCRTMEINKNTSKNTYKSLQNWWQFHLKSMLENIMQKTWKVMPTWSQNGDQNPSNKHEKTIQKNITKNYAKIKRQKAIGPEGPRARSEGAHGPGAPEEVRSSSGDSSSRFPLASNIIKKTNICQTTKKQTPRTSGCYLARTWRAGRHGADLYIYWAHGPFPASWSWAPV